MISDPAPRPIQWLSKPLPNGISVWNGVARKTKPALYWRRTYPHHKKRLVGLVSAYSSEGDTVTFIGAGRGVAPVRAAMANRHVRVYEAAKEMVYDMRATADLNGLHALDLVTIHGVVGGEYDVYGDSTDAVQYETSELSGDILVIDAEGAERDIVPAPQFDTVIVETHPQHGAATDMVRQKMGDGAKVVMTANHDGDYIVRQ